MDLHVRKYAALAASALVVTLSVATPTVAQSLITGIPLAEPAERMAMTPDGLRIYAVSQFNNSINVIDTQTDTVLAVIPRVGTPQPGDWPDDVAVSADGTRIYVVSGALNQLSIIDGATNTIVANVAIGNNPSSVALTPDGSKVYVANAGFPGMGVAVVDTVTFAIVKTLPSIFPTALARTMAVHPNGSRVYVATLTGVSVIDTSTDTVVATIPANGSRLAISPDGSRLYIHSQFANRIDVIDTSTNANLAQIPAPGSGPDPEVIAVTRDGKRVLATHFGGLRVSVIDTATNAVAASLPFPALPVGLATSPDNSAAFLVTIGSVNWLRLADNSITATIAVPSDTKSGEFPVVTPDGAKLYAACANLVCVFGTGIVTLRTVAIDIKPGEMPNSINPRSHGVIPVALLGSADFDVRSVDASSLRFGASGTEAASRQTSWTDVNRDGHVDLVLHFETRDTGLGCGDSEAVLTGTLLDGQKLRGKDSVRAVGCR